MSKVKPEEKQGWGAITFTWIGTMICVPMLITGASLVQGMSIGMAAVAALLGFGFVALIMCLNGSQGADQGYPLGMIASKTFGVTGSRLISLLIGISCIGWFGVQTATCGAAFSQLIAIMTGASFPIWASSLIWGVIMLITAVTGFGWIKILNYVAVPLLFIVCIYGCIATANSYGMEAVNNYVPATELSMMTGITLTIGAIATISVQVSDITRFAKGRGDVVKSSLVGVLPAGVLLIACGAFLALTSGSGDITVTMASIGLPFLGMIALILATWTTNTINAYSGGLAVMRVFQIKEDKRPIATAVAGLVGTVLAMAGIINVFIGFLTIIATLIPPIAGIFIADYWVIGKGKNNELRVSRGINWLGVIAWALGAAGGIFIQIGVSPAIISIVIAFAAYLILNAALGAKVTADMDPEETIHI